MHLLSIQNLTKHYGDKTLFDNAAFSLSDTDRIGIVGVNGSGKTTLLKVIAGLESPESGHITRNPKARIEYLPQNPIMDDATTVLNYLYRGQSPTMELLRSYENTVRTLAQTPNDSALQNKLVALNQKMDAENGWAAEANAKAILTRLGIREFDSLLGQLSGGQRRRVALARVLLDPADLLILDEPTNHIDPETIIWLENHLDSLNSALLMVTHDRYFLDRLTNHILEIDRGQIHTHRGNYTNYLENKAQREATRQKADLDRQTWLKKELAWLHRTPMARGGKQKARIQRAEEALGNRQVTQSQDLTINVAERRTGKQIIELDQISKSFGEAPLIRSFSYIVKKGDRLGIVGPNGSGKSTLLNLIAGRLQPDSGKIITGATIHLGYYDQEGQALNPNQRVIDNVTEIAQVIRTADGSTTTAAQMLERFQFSRKVQQAYIGTLSGGERRRLYLLRTLMIAPNVLLLDEPTNDLDIQTLSILEDYLDTYRGVLIVVSHDRYFLDRTAETIFAFEDTGVIKQYPGNYSAYQTKKQAVTSNETAAEANKKEATIKSPPKNMSKQAKPRKLSFKEQRELAQLEDRIAELEDQQASLSRQINQSGNDYQQMQTLSETLSAVEAELTPAMERWAELAEIAEG